jgi:tryptophan-rich sensory protein
MNVIPPPRPHQLLGLVAWLALSFATAAVGALASQDAGTFYGTLAQPAWAPPAWLFGPAWTVLFLGMAVAAWLVWRATPPRPPRILALTLFVVQMAANALWSWLFFAWRAGGVAFVEVLLLWALIAATLAAFWRVSRLAGLLLVPYLLWVTFAAALNWVLWRSNPASLG